MKANEITVLCAFLLGAAFALNLSDFSIVKLEASIIPITAILIIFAYNLAKLNPKPS